jgi:hypothetical protein
VRALLESLLTQEPLEGTSVPGKTSAYKLTLMKKLSQSTKPSKVKERVADLDLVQGLYRQLGPGPSSPRSEARSNPVLRPQCHPVGDNVASSSSTGEDQTMITV